MEKSTSASISEAIRNGNLELIRFLFSQNPDQINSHTYMAGQTWLGYAAQIGNILSIKELIGCGFDINIGDKHNNQRPISSAAHNGHLEAVDLLLQEGADLPTATSIENPLIAAIVGRSPAIVQLLLDAGINSTVRYNTEAMKEMDAVAFAMMQGEIECAEIIARWNTGGEHAAYHAALSEAKRIARLNVVPKRSRKAQ
jgi:uncharacterized protein